MKDVKTMNSLLSIVGTNTTNNIELLNWGKRLGIQNLQVLMIDEIKNCNMTLPINIIVNIETSKDQGAHWSCFHHSKSTAVYDSINKCYFDSYGLPPQKEIIKKFKSPIIVNDFIIQDFNTKICGQFCLYVLYKLNNGEQFLPTLLDLVVDQK